MPTLNRTISFGIQESKGQCLVDDVKSVGGLPVASKPHETVLFGNTSGSSELYSSLAQDLHHSPNVFPDGY